jgi:hypothetical protein
VRWLPDLIANRIYFALRIFLRRPARRRPAMAAAGRAGDFQSVHSSFEILDSK